MLDNNKDQNISKNNKTDPSQLVFKQKLKGDRATVESFNFRAQRKYDDSPEPQDDEVNAQNASGVGILLLVRVESPVVG